MPRPHVSEKWPQLQPCVFYPKKMPSLQSCFSPFQFPPLRTASVFFTIWFLLRAACCFFCFWLPLAAFGSSWLRSFPSFFTSPSLSQPIPVSLTLFFHETHSRDGSVKDGIDPFYSPHFAPLPSVTVRNSRRFHSTVI